MLYIGMVTYGNLEYTKAALRSLEFYEDKNEISLAVVVGKPFDGATFDYVDKWIDKHDNVKDYFIWLDEINKGFPNGVNRIMSWAFERKSSDRLLFIGNDVFLYPGTIEEMIRVQEEGGWDFVQAHEVSSSYLLRKNPQFKDIFSRDGSVLDWDKFYKKAVASPAMDAIRQVPPSVEEIGVVNGFHNCSLISRSYYESVGEVDENFYPAYFEDVDYVRRGFLNGMRFAEAPRAIYLHFHSQTAKRELVGSIRRFYQSNSYFYQIKWGGIPGRELYREPFGGLEVPAPIGNRSIEYWKWTPRRFKNAHAGQRCVIVAPGTSLNDVDPELLNGEITIALNGAYEYPGFNPTYVIAVNPKVFSRWPRILEDNKQAEGIFVPAGIAGESRSLKANTYGLYFSDPKVREFTGDVDAPIYQGHTVTYCALQLAYYMGFNRVALVGLDHYYGGIEEFPTNHAVTMNWEKDPNHFHGGYWGKGIDWDTPNMEQSEYSYNLAKSAFEKDGRVVYNCTTKTALEVFPRLSFSSFLKEDYAFIRGMGKT